MSLCHRGITVASDVNMEVRAMFGWHYGDWMPWGGLVMMIAFWALVIFGIVWLVRQSSGRIDRPGPSAGDLREPSPREVLDRRFAAGEIEEEEYRSRRAVLSGDTGKPGKL
jgi:putative membrane protein